jgi:branched-subunit amino acid ABC-type transport system permease component
VRFSAVTGLGLIPGAQVAALGLGALDSFVVDKVIPETGPTAFLSRLFPTIYL